MSDAPQNDRVARGYTLVIPPMRSKRPSGYVSSTARRSGPRQRRQLDFEGRGESRADPRRLSERTAKSGRVLESETAGLDAACPDSSQTGRTHTKLWKTTNRENGRENHTSPKT